MGVEKYVIPCESATETKKWLKKIFSLSSDISFHGEYRDPELIAEDFSLWPHLVLGFRRAGLGANLDHHLYGCMTTMMGSGSTILENPSDEQLMNIIEGFGYSVNRPVPAEVLDEGVNTRWFALRKYLE